MLRPTATPLPRFADRRSPGLPYQEPPRNTRRAQSPPSASQALKRHVGTDDYTELSFPGGHIGIYVSGKAQAIVPPAIAEWLDSKG